MKIIFKRLKMINSKIVIFVLFLFLANKSIGQKRVRYDLYVKDTIVISQVYYIAVNGQIPTLNINVYEGDLAEIYVHNKWR
jgi:hypothetical protein